MQARPSQPAGRRRLAPAALPLQCIRRPTPLAFIVLLFVMLLFRRLRKTKKERSLLGRPIQAFQSRPPTDGFRDDITAHLPWQSTIYSPTEYRTQSIVGSTHQRSLSTDMGSDPATSVPLRNYQPLHARSAKSLDELRALRQMEIDQEMQAMRAQIRQLRTQIESLQLEQSSDWSLGLSDEPRSHLPFGRSFSSSLVTQTSFPWASQPHHASSTVLLLAYIYSRATTMQLTHPRRQNTNLSFRHVITAIQYFKRAIAYVPVPLTHFLHLRRFSK